MGLKEKSVDPRLYFQPSVLAKRTQSCPVVVRGLRAEAEERNTGWGHVPSLQDTPQHSRTHPDMPEEHVLAQKRQDHR